MEQIIPERYAGIIGIGVMYLWGTASVTWVSWAQSEVLFMKIIGVAGALLASLCGIAIYLYVSGIESQLRVTREKIVLYENEAKIWSEQAQLAISHLEQDRAKSS